MKVHLYFPNKLNFKINPKINYKNNKIVFPEGGEDY
jgi:hypothetical protein